MSLVVSSVALDTRGYPVTAHRSTMGGALKYVERIGTSQTDECLYADNVIRSSTKLLNLKSFVTTNATTRI